MAHPELPAEQAYVDEAYDCLDRMREVLLQAAEAGSSEVAAEAIESWASGRLRTFEDAERGLCFGRIDGERTAERTYVGRRWVHDDDRRTLVVNWQAPAARPFYTATPREPHGVTLRRRFRTQGRRLLGISDETLDGSLADAGLVDDLLLEELDRARDQRMRDIVATIQADQYHLIASDPEPPLVIQGGPGTGKTAVGLHRASFLLYCTEPSSGACSSLARTAPSWTTSRTSCRPSARTAWSSGRWPSSSTVSRRLASMRPRLRV